MWGSLLLFLTWSRGILGDKHVFWVVYYNLHANSQRIHSLVFTWLVCNNNGYVYEYNIIYIIYTHTHPRARVHIYHNILVCVLMHIHIHDRGLLLVLWHLPVQIDVVFHEFISNPLTHTHTRSPFSLHFTIFKSNIVGMPLSYILFQLKW